LFDSKQTLFFVLDKVDCRIIRGRKMTTEIPRSEWKRFFGSICRSYLDWQTSIEVQSGETSARVLSKNLPLMSLTAEEKNGECKIEIMLGDAASNQTHNIGNPRKVYCRRDPRNLRGTIEIEDESHTKTFLHIIQPIPASIVYADHQIDLRTF
jgi:hypothetical protein